MRQGVLNMLGKKNKQLSLGQTEAVSRLPKDHFLKVIEKRIDWRPIEKELNNLYSIQKRKTELSSFDDVQGAFAFRLRRSINFRILPWRRP
jgi:catalase (peroxidase I)